MDRRSQDYLRKFFHTLSGEERGRYTSVSADCFCGDEAGARYCADLILHGQKTATCSMKYWYETGEEEMPRVGGLMVVTDFYGTPTSIIETTSVEECRFCDVSQEHAFAEGEGDRSYESWRNAHWRFFARECSEIGIEMTEDTWLILERFQLVYSE